MKKSKNNNNRLKSFKQIDSKKYAIDNVLAFRNEYYNAKVKQTQKLLNINTLLMFVLTFILFNGIINELLYNNFFSLQVSWRYNTMLSAPIDVDISKDEKQGESNVTMINIIKNDSVSLDSFESVIIRLTNLLPKDTLFLDKCAKGQRNSYVAEKFRTLAIYQQLKYRIPASVTLAQIIHETGHGTSRMFRHSNQLFGRKCFADKKNHWFAHKTEVEQLIRKGIRIHKAKHCNWYPDERDKFNRYNRFVNYNTYYDSGMDRYYTLLKPRYNKLFKQKDPLNPVTSHYKVWTKGLKDGGWATDVNYTKLLNDIIASRNFQVIDENVERYRELMLKENGELYLQKKLILYKYKIKLITNTNFL